MPGIALGLIALGLFSLGAPVFSQIPLPPSGTIAVTCHAGDSSYQSGKIFIDGSEVGKCPGASIQVSTGVHTVRAGEALGNDRYMAYQNERVEVQKDSTQNVIANLTLVSTEQAAGLAYALGAKKIEINHLNRPDDSKLEVLSRDGKILAVGAETNSIRLYDATSGEPLGRLGESGEYWVSSVTAIALSADGSLLAGNGWQRDKYSGEINIWDMKTRRRLRTIPNLKEVFALGFSPDGKLLAAGVGLNEVRVWNVTSGRLLWSETPPGAKDKKISQLIFSADSKLLVTGPHFGEDISVYDVSTAKHRKSLRGNLVMLGKAGIAFTFSYRGAYTTLQSEWRLSTGELIGSKTLQNTSAVRARNEQVVLAASRGTNGLDSRNERLMRTLNDPVQIVLSPDGARWLIAEHIGSILSLPAFPGSGEARVQQGTPTIEFCSMVRNAKTYFDKRVRIVARYQMAIEAVYLEDDQCPLTPDQRIGADYPKLDEEQQDIRNAEIRKISSHEYGGRAIVTVVGTLRNASRHDFAWYQYRFDIESVEGLSPVTIPYERELQATVTYRANVLPSGDDGLKLIPEPKQREHSGMRIEWINLNEFPELNKAGEHRILFTVLSDEIKQMTERRWNRTLRCKILRVE